MPTFKFTPSAELAIDIEWYTAAKMFPVFADRKVFERQKEKDIVTLIELEKIQRNIEKIQNGQKS